MWQVVPCRTRPFQETTEVKPPLSPSSLWGEVKVRGEFTNYEMYFRDMAPGYSESIQLSCPVLLPMSQPAPNQVMFSLGEHPAVEL
jgi:hypothetical protein